MMENRVRRKLVLVLLLLPEPSSYETNVPVAQILNNKGSESSQCQVQLETFHVTSYILQQADRKSTRLNSSHDQISYAVFCLKKKKCFSHFVQFPSAVGVLNCHREALLPVYHA